MQSSKIKTCHLVPALRRANMNLCLSTNLVIKRGLGELEYPPALKSEALKSSIQCDSLYMGVNPKAKNEPYFLTCSGSTYWAKDGKIKNNILGMFMNKKKANVVSFSHGVPVTVPQEKLEVKIVDLTGKQQDLSCIGVFRIHGPVSNKLLAI